MAMFYVYALTDPRRNNQFFYIGKGTGDRAKSHLTETYQKTGNRRKWCKIAAIRKSGQEPGIVIIHGDLTEDQAYELEAKLITHYGRRGYEEAGILTNICIDNRPPSALGRECSAETRKKISEKQKGELNHRFGAVWSDEAKEQRRQYNLEHGVKPPSAKGRKRSEETKRKMSEAMKGYKKTPEHIQKLSDAVRGKKRGPRTAETKAKLSAWQQRLYTFVSPEGKTYKVRSAKLKEFCKSFGMSYGSVMAAVKAGRPLFKGWSITRLEPDEIS